MPEPDGCRGVRYVSLLGGNGYFVAAKRLMLAMAGAGVPFTWDPVSVRGVRRGPDILAGRAIGDRDLDPYCLRALDYDTVIIHTPPEIFAECARREPGKRLIGHTTWETDTLPAHWPQLFDVLEQLLVPSEWNRAVFLRGGTRVPIAVLPHVLGPTAPVRSPRWDDIAPETFVFYLIEEWTARKNLAETISLYRRTFTRDENTLLIVKTSTSAYRPFPFPRLVPRLVWARKLYGRIRSRLAIPGRLSLGSNAALRMAAIERTSAGGGRVRMVTGQIDEADIAGLHQRGDCYLSLSHGEGWGIGAFDAAAAGNPVVATGWGGALDYLDPHYAWVVGCDLVIARDDENLAKFKKQHRWAQPRAEAAAAMMRRVAADPEAARARAQAWVPTLQRKFSAPAVAQRLRKVLDSAQI